MVGTGSATRAGNRTAKSESRRTVWTWRAAWACGALRTRIGCEGVEVGAGVSSAVAVLVIVVGAVVGALLGVQRERVGLLEAVVHGGKRRSRWWMRVKAGPRS